jgi:hypothetical protein
MAENTRKNAPNTRGKPFSRGNPGKPKGARHKTTLLAERLMHDDAADVTRAVIKAAKDGDMQAARIILDRIAPARRDNPVMFELPQIESASDASKAMGALLNAVASGDVTPGEGEAVARLIGGFIDALEANEFEMRLRTLEEKGPKR